MCHNDLSAGKNFLIEVSLLNFSGFIWEMLQFKKQDGFLRVRVFHFKMKNYLNLLGI